ncbi:GRB2-associated-binding protein 2-like [Sciurus carolinensis]|uniref:GRB2-associated-binding protein 2-like n=1 Tax=Sciurus carolinensis TaxID=30640 RepID=UPI001FB46ECF|nr:GRB2-associated-binding protein 2-like [Sciurus carolinensis]
MRVAHASAPRLCEQLRSSTPEATEADLMDSTPVVHAGWLRKSPPEKKLRLCAWRKRWFILQSSQCSGDPGVLEYCKHDQSKKLLRIISLDLCEQMQANVTFHKKGLPCDFVFNIKTNKRTFYLVAERKEDMYKWVQSICQICGFKQEVESTGSLRTISTAHQEPCSSLAELTLSWQQHLQEQRCSTLPHHSQPTLLTGYPLEWEEAQPTWSSRAPQQHLHPYLHLDQSMSHGAESARSDNVSQGSRNSFLVKSDIATQNVAQGGGPCVPGIHGQAQGLSSFPEACKNYLWGTKSAELAADSRAHGDNFHQAEERDTSHVNEAGFGDDYVPMSTLPSILLGMERVGGNSQNSHNPK